MVASVELNTRDLGGLEKQMWHLLVRWEAGIRPVVFRHWVEPNNHHYTMTALKEVFTQAGWRVDMSRIGRLYRLTFTSQVTPTPSEIDAAEIEGYSPATVVRAWLSKSQDIAGDCLAVFEKICKRESTKDRYRIEHKFQGGHAMEKAVALKACFEASGWYVQDVRELGSGKFGFTFTPHQGSVEPGSAFTPARAAQRIREYGLREACRFV
jgi:hypothetical protein